MARPAAIPPSVTSPSPLLRAGLAKGTCASFACRQIERGAEGRFGVGVDEEKPRTVIDVVGGGYDEDPGRTTLAYCPIQDGEGDACHRYADA